MAKTKPRKKRVKRKPTPATLPGTLTGSEMNGFPVMRVKARDLQGADYNPREIDEESLGGLRASVDEFGMPQPIIWNRRTQRLVGGHQRLKTLGPEDETDVIVVDLPLEKEKALNVALNNPEIQGSWDDSINSLLAEIQVEVPDIAKDLKIDDLLSEFSTPRHTTEVVKLSSLKEHPRNYRDHPEDQIAQIAQSIKQHGFYRNIAVARDGTILAGHGVTLAAKSLGLKKIPIRRLDLDPNEPKALKLLAGDNELSRTAAVDDRSLANLLKEVMDMDPEGLLGTGFDEAMLAGLLMVSRSASEIRDFDEAAEWVGMPDYDQPDERIKVSVSFRSHEDVQKFAKKLGLELEEGTKSMWYPPKEREDPSSYRFEG